MLALPFRKKDSHKTALAGKVFPEYSFNDINLSTNVERYDMPKGRDGKKKTH